ncbi:MAG: MATE family efflux transporter [Acidobacteria bacterium]|nr:MAG: MATE family efflux transporter [Acidobacteriota bacterium]
MGLVRRAFMRNPRDGAIAALAIPALGTLAIDPLISIIDTIWVSKLGTSSLAAIAIASAVFGAVFAVLGFVHVTITPLVAGEVGRNNLPQAGGVTKGAFVVSVGIGVVVAGVAVLLAEPVVELFGASGDVLAQAVSYLQIRMLALPAMLVAMVGHGVYRGHQDTRTPLYVTIAMNIVNLVLDPILIFGLGMGIVGAAWATVIAQLIAATAFLVLMFGRDRSKLGLNGRIGDARGIEVSTILVKGWPMMVRSMALLFALTATTVAAARIGVAEVAAHQIAFQIWLFLAFVLDSLAVAAMAMIGMDLGRKDTAAARDLAHRMLALGLMMGAVLGLGLAIAEPFLAGLFSADVPVSEGLSSIVWIVVLLQPITALVYVWDGIAIGASAFRFMAVTMVCGAAVTVLCLALIGDTLTGVWLSIGALSVSRLAASLGWQIFGPLAREQDPSPSSPVDGSREQLK